MKRAYLFAAVFFTLWLTTPAWAEVAVENAWVRMPPPVADTAAGYLVLKNSGEQSVAVVSVECDAAAEPEFHSMQTHDGMVHMQKMERVEVPAGGSIEFAPGGDHLMMKGLTKELKAGEHVTLRIAFSNGESVTVQAQVIDMRGQTGGHGHADGHHH